MESIQQIWAMIISLYIHYQIHLQQVDIIHHHYSLIFTDEALRSHVISHRYEWS